VTDPRKSLNILAPTSAKPKLDYLHRQLYRDAAERSGLNRRELLGLGALGEPQGHADDAQKRQKPDREEREGRANDIAARNRGHGLVLPDQCGKCHVL